ncbi:MAG: hypothetical protein LLG45_13205 [Actinomycetia bacterium]|nr:hypothetical protein [Actinomycetes bacterium]
MAKRYDTANLTPEEREQLLIKMVPGDVISVRPGLDKGCPCPRCTGEWGEGLYANGDRQRGGWCPELRQLVGVKAGSVSRYCPHVPEGGEVHDPGTVRWEPFKIILAGAPVKGSVEVSRRTTFSNFPTMQPRRGELAPPPKPRRERAGTLEGGC